MARYWVYQVNDGEEPQGPYRPEKIREKFDFREIQVCREGRQEWCDPQEFDELIETDTDQNDTTTSESFSGQSQEITVMFVKLSGLSEITAAMGAEEGRRVSNALFDQVESMAEEHGGRVDKFMEETGLIVFGLNKRKTPGADEALQTSIQLKQQVERFNQQNDTGLELKVGIDTRMVLAAEIGAEGTRDRSVVGSGVNRAARYTGVVEPGGVLVGERTRKCLDQDYELERKPGLDLKGIEGSVTAFLLEP